MTIRATLKRIAPIIKSYQLLKFLAFHTRLGWTAWRDRRDLSSAHGNFPLPPGRLRFRVHGDLEAKSFITTGFTVAGNIGDLITSAGYNQSAFHDILDFGCGCGRVLRHIAPLGLHARLYGTDIDAQAIRWCEAHMPGVTWRINQFLPPLSWPDASFDFVFSISVFTHLNIGMQNSWLVELQRVTRTGGLLLLTIHGEYVHRTLPDEQHAALRKAGFLYLTGTMGRLKLDGLPDFYQAAYHTREYIETEWSKFFQVIAIVPRGINAHQDAVLLRRL